MSFYKSSQGLKGAEGRGEGGWREGLWVVGKTAWWDLTPQGRAGGSIWWGSGCHAKGLTWGDALFIITGDNILDTLVGQRGKTPR